MKKKYLPLLIFLCLALVLGAYVSSKPYVHRYFCVGCGDCVKNCPTGAISLQADRAVIDPQICIDCGFCVRSCSYNAVRRPK